jgi:hypothetical protein
VTASLDSREVRTAVTRGGRGGGVHQSGKFTLLWGGVHRPPFFAAAVAKSDPSIPEALSLAMPFSAFGNRRTTRFAFPPAELVALLFTLPQRLRGSVDFEVALSPIHRFATQGRSRLRLPFLVFCYCELATSTRVHRTLANRAIPGNNGLP